VCVTRVVCVRVRVRVRGSTRACVRFDIGDASG